MSTFDNPFDPKRMLNSSGCSCGRHVSQAEHERDAVRQLQCAAIEAPVSDEKRYEGVVASAVMRAIFPKDVARRAFLRSVGASTALAAISQFFPLSTATEVFGQGAPLEKKDLKVGFIPIILRHPDHYGASDGLL
jgi:nitrate/nitrite transport system substrate-binding protein